MTEYKIDCYLKGHLFFFDIPKGSEVSYYFLCIWFADQARSWWQDIQILDEGLVPNIMTYNKITRAPCQLI